MLAVTSYPKTYVDACRAEMAKQFKTFRALPAGAPRDQFEPEYAKTLVLALDHFFLHRMRGAEGKDGNALNEMRMLCNAITDNAGVLSKDGSIKYDAQKSVSGIALGDAVKLDCGTVEKLAEAVFIEIGKRFA